MSKQSTLRDRDIDALRTSAMQQSMRAATISAQQMSASANEQPLAWQMEAVSTSWPFQLQGEAGVGRDENQAGNRFGASEICEACEQPHMDSNYVATDANGISFCGDCWDAALGVTIVARCQSFASSQCACGSDLREERWFAVSSTPLQTPYCQACSLSFWGFTAADMTVTAISDNRTPRRGRSRGAHLPLGLAMKPNDDTSPCAGLSDRGFSRPCQLEDCMNLAPQPGEPPPHVSCAHTCTHTHGKVYTGMISCTCHARQEARELRRVHGHSASRRENERVVTCAMADVCITRAAVHA